MRSMKLFLVFLFVTISVSAQNVPLHFSKFVGMEDTLGRTHLFYQVYSYEEIQYYGFPMNNSVYHLDVSNQRDTILISAFGSYISAYKYVNDFKVWNLEPLRFIYCGDVCGIECSPYIFQYPDGLIFSTGMWGNAYSIDISSNGNVIYSGMDAWDMENIVKTIRSVNGGLNWDTLSSKKIFISVNPYNENTSFYTDFENEFISKSTDGGFTFYLVGTVRTFIIPDFPRFYYDPDGLHIYRIFQSGGSNYFLSVSNNQGEAFSWSIKYNSNNPILISLDSTQSGSVYLADGKRIFRSTDYGNTFSLYQEIDHRIIGIYKKPNSNKLYAATKYRIYELTDNTIIVIKSLPMPHEILAYYPVAIGNTWVYDYTWFETPVASISDIFVRKIINEVLKPNGKKYFEIKEKYVAMGLENTVYERVDTIEGKIYRYEEFCPDSEQFIDDLLIEVGDSTSATRFGYCIEHPPTELLSETFFNEWGIYSNERKYLSNDLLTAHYSLVKDIGLYSYSLADDNGEKVFQLKGMLKDGIVYGDTSLIVGIRDDDLLSPTEFKLYQNYPNPFNPSTKIRYTIPSVGTSLMKFPQFVQLKVYDVLGNEVATLVAEYEPAGNHEVEFSTKGGQAVSDRQLASGIYYYQLKVGEFVQTKKMILLR